MSTTVIVNAVVGFMIAVVLFGAAMTSFTAQSTTNWSASTVTVWTLLPILAILGVALLIFTNIRQRAG